ncbi:M42 family metallopeptidase [Deinococcus sp. KNUC1210]|uniref:M42 family metallopeptidase n=1 Tax=Deinococcus sp. KNUC1210 TaxID=2917691 RepID=UPI001EF0DDFC|nr:M42 family metallopeptidase [Deinococcus sp. KNUC1210]ULH14494.1 M42 family metallopeptidase [Deinococcus sp. KNUC1210]
MDNHLHSVALPQLEMDATIAFLLDLLKTPSPTGFTEAAILRIEQELTALGVIAQRTAKGGLVWTLEPAEEAEDTGQHVTFSAHADTLGAMVKEIRPNGRLGLTQLGSYDWHSIEGTEVKVHPQQGPALSGTVLNLYQSFHVWGSAIHDLKRSANTLEVRLDALTGSEAQTRALGIEVGDFVSFDSQAQFTASGYIKGRHLDNKASIAIFVGVTRELLRQPSSRRVSFCITVYEEVGHGAASDIPAGTSELIAVDMAAVGGNQTSSEHHVTLCVKDSLGPYDHALGNRLRTAARRAGLELKIDIYPYYSSDASAAWRAGLPCPTALIGPGVDASHAYERTHQDALVATTALMLEYLR